VKDWLKGCGVQTYYIDPGSPWQNAYGDSFNDKFRDEWVSLEWFHSVAEARVITHRWRQYYNEARPPSSLGYQTPAEFRTVWGKEHAGALPTDPWSLTLLGPSAGQIE
jgi:putative transposase